MDISQNNTSPHIPIERERERLITKNLRLLAYIRLIREAHDSKFLEDYINNPQKQKQQQQQNFPNINCLRI